MTSKPVCPQADDRVVLGKIVKVRGLRGDLKIYPLTSDPARFNDFQGVWCGIDDENPEYYTIKRIRIERNMVYLRFKEVPFRDLAELLVGKLLFIDESERLELPENHYYLDDMVGCQVECSHYGNVGILKEVLDMPAHDIWRVEGQYGEVLIPAVKEYVQKVDTVAGQLKVNLPEGLIED